jgi:hypothetical protein
VPGGAGAETPVYPDYTVCPDTRTGARAGAHKGFDRATTLLGTGLQGVTDRLAAIGSTDVTSAPGHGAQITGRIPTARDSGRDRGRDRRPGVRAGRSR